MRLIAELWRRALATQPLPGAQGSALLGVAALVVVALAWPLVRLLVTICHEAGHALVAVLAGRRLSGIRVHSDTSGLTVSRGRPRGPGMVATLLAGYPAPAVVGLGLAVLAGTGHAAGVLWLLVLLGVVLLVWVRNLYGALVVVLAAGAVGAVTWYAPPAMLGWVATGLAWLFLWAAPRPVLELLAHHSPGSDAAQLGALTRIPKFAWSLLWLVLTVAALAGGALLMVPGLYGWVSQLWSQVR
ncbi:MAG TPA: M50 family metallopeptidase [Propionibacteriaceae bacterium]|nr:M50 family metallopeptidase [Propionibacteriaceae bacterium]